MSTEPVAYGKVNVEISEIWVRQNAAQFALTMLDFTARHPGKDWNLGLQSRPGFFTLIAIRKPTN